LPYAYTDDISSAEDVDRDGIGRRGRCSGPRLFGSPGGRNPVQPGRLSHDPRERARDRRDARSVRSGVREHDRPRHRVNRGRLLAV